MNEVDSHIAQNPELNIWEALLPAFALIAMLAYNVYVFGDDALSGSNQFILLLGGAVAAIVGFRNHVSYRHMMDEVGNNFKSITEPVLILLFVGALAGTWLVSGVIPSMIYYGLKILSPGIFLPASVIICAIISVATGSSWTTTATVGIALIGIGKAIGIDAGMVAGAVISGAYFGDKMSPLSDTTNLAPAMAGGKLFDHIRYMSLTTVPTILITLVVFIIISLTQTPSDAVDTKTLLSAIDSKFYISPILFLVPAVVIFLIVRKTKPLIALLVGVLLGALFAVIFQPNILKEIIGAGEVAGGLGFGETYKAILQSITVDVAVTTEESLLNDLFSSGGMKGMLGTIWLIVCAMVFGGIMDAIGALARISQALLKLADSTFSLFASTVASCLALNVTASDQYLAIVVPGKMFAKAYEEKGLAPENLSRTLEDSGTVTSVLIPWNTCGAYQSGVLGVGVGEYFFYAIFNYLSPFMTLLFAALNIKIKQLSSPQAS